MNFSGGCDNLLKPRIVVIGAGYAGLTTIRQLQKKIKRDEAEIILINKHDYHFQTTWLHRNAVGTLSYEETRFFLDPLLDRTKVKFVKASVLSLDVEKKIVITTQDKVMYDYLVVALGSEIDTFQIPGLKEHAFSITTLEKSTTLYRRLNGVFQNFNQTENEHLTIVIGGGGFTGVELLGELTEQLPYFCQLYQVDPARVKLIGVEIESTVLPEFDLELGEYAMHQLEARGVEFRLGATIKSVAHDRIKIKQGSLIEEIPASVFVWTAGVKGNRLLEQSALPTNDSRVEINQNLTAPGYPEVFVIGDVARVKDSEGKGYLPNADLAMKKAYLCANNILAFIRKQPNKIRLLKIQLFGTIASIGRKDGIGVIFNKKVFGKTAVVLKRLLDRVILYKIGGIKLLFGKDK